MAVTTKNLGEYKVIRCLSVNANTTWQLPAGYYIASMVIDNNSAASVDIVMGYGVPTDNILASTTCLNASSQIIDGFNMAKNQISSTASYTINVASSSWTTASIDIYITLVQYK